MLIADELDPAGPVVLVRGINILLHVRANCSYAAHSEIAWRYLKLHSLIYNMYIVTDVPTRRTIILNFYFIPYWRKFFYVGNKRNFYSNLFLFSNAISTSTLSLFHKTIDIHKKRITNKSQNWSRIAFL